MDIDSWLPKITETLQNLVDLLRSINPGIDPTLWALIVLGVFGLIAVFSRKLIGLLVAAAVIAAGIFVAWHMVGG